MLILTLGIVGGQLIRIPFGPGAVIALDIIISAFCLLGAVKLKFKLFNPPLFLKYAFLFLLVTLLSLIFTPLNLSQNELMISFSYIIRLSIYILFCYLLFSVKFDDFKKDIPTTLMLSGTLLSILGLIQFIFLPNLQFLTSMGWDPHYFRTVSTFLDPNFAGAFFVLTIILWYQKFAIAKKWYLLIFVILYLALLTTFSRSSYLMFLVSGVSLSLLKKSKKLFVLTVVLFLFLFIGFQIYSQLISKPRNIDRGQSASFRFNTWQQGLTLFQQSPILGVGFNTYRYGVREFNLGDEQFLSSHGASSNDSSLLYVLATTGVIGLTIYSLFILNIFKHSYLNNPVAFSGLAGLLIHSIFANSLFYPPILLWILIISTLPKK